MTTPTDADRPATVEQIHVFGTAIAVTGQARDITVSVGEERFWIEAFPLEVKETEELRGLRPSHLLAARHQVVPFDPRRQPALDELTAWRDSAGRLRVRLLHGAGGQGKTRLAMELVKQSKQAGWAVARARHFTDLKPATGAGERDSVKAAGLVVVIDYAERWPREDLLAVFRHRLVHQGLPTRVLLLARTAGWWWESLLHPLGEVDAVGDAVELGSLPGEELGNRQAVFAAARDRFAEVLDVADPASVQPPGDLRAPAFGLALTIHMAALAAVDAHADRELPPTSPAELSVYLLQREGAHWAAMHANGRISTEPQTLSRVVFTATLTRPVPYDEGLTILRDQVELAASTETAQSLLDDHQRCYPPTEAGTILEPLYPDRLAEDFLATLLPGPAEPSRGLADAWTQTALARLVAPTFEGALPAYGGQAIAVLIETARRWPHVGNAHLYPLLREHPVLALAAGSPAVTGLAQTADIDLLEPIEELLPRDQHVELDVAAAAISQRLTEHRLASTTDPAEQARLYRNLGFRLTNAGMRAQAHEAAQHAADIYQELAQSNPAYEPDLAISLDNLGATQGRLGRRNEALESTRQAVKIKKRLAQSNPAYEPDLASTQVNLGISLADMGQRQEALEVTQQAVDIWRRQADPAACAPHLARSLRSLANHLSDAGRWEDALSAAQQAMEIYWSLAQSDPAAYEPDLATSLDNLGRRLWEAGQRGKALEVTQQAVDIWLRLAQVNPAAHEPHLAGAVTNLSARLAGAGRREDALSAAEQAVEIYRRLAQGDPAAYERDFAISLDNLGVHLSEAGQREKALSAAQQAVHLWQRLADGNPAAHETQLAGALDNLGNRLSEAGRRMEALECTLQAAKIYGRLVQSNPAHEPALAGTLGNLGRRLWEAGYRANALRASQAAVEIYGRLARSNPAAYEPDLAASLSNLGTLLSRSRRDGAIEATQRAVDLWRRLAEDNPAAHEPDLARGLSGFAGIRVEAEVELEEALAAAKESVEIYRRLARHAPAAHNGGLQDARGTLVAVSRCAGSRRRSWRDPRVPRRGRYPGL